LPHGSGRTRLPSGRWRTRLDFADRLSSDQVEQVSTRIEQQLHGQFPQVDEVFLDATAVADAGAQDRRMARESARPRSCPRE